MYKNSKKKDIIFLHTGDDPESGGIQNVARQIIYSFEGNGFNVYSFCVKSKLSFVFICFLLFFRGFGSVVVFSHLGLARMHWVFFPLSKKFIFLHGVEAWKKVHLNPRLGFSSTVFLVNSFYTWRKFLVFNQAFQSNIFKVVPLGLGGVVSVKSTPSPVPIAIIIGRLSKNEDYKGHRPLIGCWSSVRKKVPNAELWIVGDGDQIQDLKTLSNNKEGIKFFGKVSPKKKETMLCESRCLVMPSKGEGFGLVYLEAMRLGRPCLVSNQDAGREVVNPPECGLEVDPDKPEQIVEAMERLLVLNSFWKTMSGNAKKRYDSFFTSQHFQKRFIEALN